MPLLGLIKTIAFNRKQGFMNCLITKQGKVIECNGGTPHEVICVGTLKITLKKFLTKQSGIRIKRKWPNSEALAIEYYDKPSEAQLRVIRKILRQDDYYTVVLNLRTISKFRPIRGFQV